MSQTKAQTRGGCGLPKFMEKAVLPLCTLDRIAGGTDLTSSLHAMSCQLWSRQAQLSAFFFRKEICICIRVATDVPY